MKIHYAIFAAMPEELKPLEVLLASCKTYTLQVRHFNFKIIEHEHKKILLAPTGIGTAFAALVVALIHDHFQPDYLFMLGTAGGINTSLTIRDIVVAENAYEAEIQGMFTAVKDTPFESCLQHPLNTTTIPTCYKANAELLAIAKQIANSRNDVHVGPIVTSNAFPAPLDLYNAVKAEGAYAIDMETSAFYQTAWLLNVPAIALRGISNFLDAEGKDDKIHESDIPGSTHAAACLLLQMLNNLSHAHPPLLTQEANEIIRSLKLESHPEGGYFSPAYQSTHRVLSTDPSRYHQEERSAGSSIYYLLNTNDFSAWHKLTSDEIWHYYKGSPVQIYAIDAAGQLTSFILGNTNELKDAQFQICIPADVWFAAENIDKETYSLVGCTVSPGFEYRDFTLAKREDLQKQFPAHTDLINRLTRSTHEKRISCT